MKKHRISAGRLAVLLLALALSVLPLAVASAHELMVPRSDPANGSTVSASSGPAQFGAELDTTGSSRIWMVEALTGALLVLGLGETLRRRHS